MDIIWNLFYTKIEFLLFVKTGFGKSLIFLLASFEFNLTEVIIIIILLKFFQAKQNSIINQISCRKTIALTQKTIRKKQLHVSIIYTFLPT